MKKAGKMIIYMTFPASDYSYYSFYRKPVPVENTRSCDMEVRLLFRKTGSFTGSFNRWCSNTSFLSSGKFFTMRPCLIILLTALSFVFTDSVYAQYRSKYPDIPIVDVHVHPGNVGDVANFIKVSELLKEKHESNLAFCVALTDPGKPVAEEMKVAAGNRMLFTASQMRPHKGLTMTAEEVIAKIRDDGYVGFKFWFGDPRRVVKEGEEGITRIDDPSFEPFFSTLERNHVLMTSLHIADPNGPFGDRTDWLKDPVDYWEQIRAFENVVARHPNLTIIAAHGAWLVCQDAQIDYLRYMLKTYPNLYFDVSATFQYMPLVNRENLRDLYMEYQDRILYGTDGGKIADNAIGYFTDRYAKTFAILETDEIVNGDFFGNKPVRGLDLPREVLEKIYYKNAIKLYPGLKEAMGIQEAVNLVDQKDADNDVVVYPAPEGEELNAKFKVSVNGMDVPVYNARICTEDQQGRHRAGILAEADLAYDITAFASFDMKKGPVSVTVSIDDPIFTAKILPTSFGIMPVIKGNAVSFEVAKHQHITVEVNGDHIRSLHLFVNPEETNIPDPNDPNVIYYGPGIHEITSVPVIGDNITVYIAGGAVVRSVLPEEETGRRAPSFILRGKNITFRGRGIFDQGRIPRLQGRNTMQATVDGLKMEGVIFCNSSTWTVSLRDCNNVHIDNIKIFGHRANSDGIDINSSLDVLVENCFLRTWDDLIVVKTLRGSNQDAERIHVRKCVLYNEIAHALSIGAELTRKVEDVLFEDCDIIGDHGREWTLRIYHTDKALIKNVRFENIRIEESVKFASLWINSAIWTTDDERGHIEDVVFRNITVNNSGYPLHREFEFLGFDAEHAIRNVLIDNVVINGRKVVREDIVINPRSAPKEGIVTNDHVFNVTVK